MIVLITGAPGAGKTLLAVKMLLDWSRNGVAMQDGTKRALDLYVHGVPDLCMERTELSAEQVHRWHEPDVVRDGAVVLIDEVQEFWRQRPNGAAVPPAVQSFERHRHRGLTFILCTQHPQLLDLNIRKLVGRHLYLRDVGMLGRRVYEFPEATDHTQFAKAVTNEAFKLPKEVFGVYKSASLHVKVPRKVPKAVKFMAAAVLAMVPLGVYLAQSVRAKMQPAQPQPHSAAAPTARHASIGAAGGPLQVRGQLEPAQPKREPYAGLQLHVSGSVHWDGGAHRTWFTVSADGRPLATVADRELYRQGYGWRAMGPCVGVLIWGDAERVVTCDPPMVVPASHAASAAS